MISSAEDAMFAHFLDFVLQGKRPSLTEGTLPAGVRWTWLGDGIVRFDPLPSPGRARLDVVASAGIHGDETAPIEMLSLLVADIAAGRTALNCRLLVIFGNIEAMRASCRYRDDDLNRIFNGRHLALASSREAPRAAEIENVTRAFFEADPLSAGHAAHAKWHIDLHTAIRASVFEQFALLPYTGAPPSDAMFDWLQDARLSAVLLHREKSNTFTHFTAEQLGALSCTLELGKVRPFGCNDLSRFAASDAALRRLIGGADVEPRSERGELRVFTVVGQIDKHSDRFELHVAADVANFTPFARGTVMANDGDYRYEVTHDEERIVFPNAKVKPGLRAGLMVVETARIPARRD